MERNEYYIGYSSWFTNNYYDYPKMLEIVKQFDVKRVRMGRQFKMRNQPDVVWFHATPEVAKQIEAKLNEAFNTEWVHVWKWEKITKDMVTLL